MRATRSPGYGLFVSVVWFLSCTALPTEDSGLPDGDVSFDNSTSSLPTVAESARLPAAEAGTYVYFSLAGDDGDIGVTQVRIVEDDGSWFRYDFERSGMNGPLALREIDYLDPSIPNGWPTTVRFDDHARVIEIHDPVGSRLVIDWISSEDWRARIRFYGPELLIDEEVDFASELGDPSATPQLSTLSPVGSSGKLLQSQTVKEEPLRIQFELSYCDYTAFVPPTWVNRLGIRIIDPGLMGLSDTANTVDFDDVPVTVDAATGLYELQISPFLVGTPPPGLGGSCSEVRDLLDFWCPAAELLGIRPLCFVLSRFSSDPRVRTLVSFMCKEGGELFLERCKLIETQCSRIDLGDVYELPFDPQDGIPFASGQVKIVAAWANVTLPADVADSGGRYTWFSLSDDRESDLNNEVPLFTVDFSSLYTPAQCTGTCCPGSYLLPYDYNSPPEFPYFGVCIDRVTGEFTSPLRSCPPGIDCCGNE